MNIQNRVDGVEHSAPLIPPPDFRVLFESLPGLYLVLTPDFKIAAVSDAYLQATMRSRYEIIGRRIFEVFPDNPDDTTATGVRNLSDSLERVIRQGVSDTMAVQKYDVRRPEAEGGEFEERYWSPRNSPVFGSDGGVTHIIHRVEDVTQFVRLKQRENEQEKLTQTLRSRGEQMEAEILQRAQEIQEGNRLLRAAQAELEQRVQERTAELTARTAELAASNVALRREIDDRKRVEVELYAKTEELKATTQQFCHAARLAGVGELAASIAHELNNPLCTVTLHVEGLLDASPPDAPSRKSLEVIDGEVERMAGLVANLLQFSRAGCNQVSTVDVCEEMTKTIDLISHLLRKRRIRLEPEFAAGVPVIHADRQHLRQVFLNLFMNAADAMPTGGCLTPRVRIAELPGGVPAIVIEVADTGVGIPAELLPRVFDPFFTTKEEGKGTGLGLAICKRIVEQHHGTLAIESEVGRGTTIRVTLPVRLDTNVTNLHIG